MALLKHYRNVQLHEIKLKNIDPVQDVKILQYRENNVLVRYTSQSKVDKTMCFDYA